MDVNFFVEVGLDNLQSCDLIYINYWHRVVSCSFQFSFALTPCSYFLILCVIEFHINGIISTVVPPISMRDMFQDPPVYP